jgi:hypothetical protein
MKITSDLTNLTTVILILTVQMFIEWTLPQEFDGRLGSVRLQFWHIHVIHKHDNLFAQRGPQQSLLLLLQFQLQNLLRPETAGLRRKVDRHGDV